MKKRILCIGFALLLLLGITACGAANSSGASTQAAAPAAGEMAAYDTAAAEEAGDAPAESPAAEPNAGTGLPNPEGRKLIYTGNLTLYTSQFDRAVPALTELVEGSEGYFSSQELYQHDGDMRSAYYTVRVPSDRFDQFLHSVAEEPVCKLVYQSTGVEDVSEVYYDIENRLETQQTMLNRLNELLSQAENMEDILAIQSQITEVEYQIESLTGERNHYDSLIDYSTVYISLEEVSEVVEEMEPGFGQRLVSGFQDSWRNFVSGVQALVVGMARHSIALVVLAVIAVVVILVVRRSGKKRKERQQMVRQMMEQSDLGSGEK